MVEDRRIKHGSRSRVKAGCTCDVCTKAALRFEWADARKKDPSRDEYQGRAVGMSDIGWIILQVRKMSEDKTLPASKRARARWWYNRLTLAEQAPATPIVTESGGRRRSHNGRRQVSTDLAWDGPYQRPLIET